VGEITKLKMATERQSAEICADYGPALHRFFSRRAQNPSDVKELVQEVHARYVKTVSSATPQNPKALLYGIASNVCKEFLRRARRNPVLTDSQIASQFAEFPPIPPRNDPCIAMEARSELDSYFRLLPKTHRAVLVLTRSEGLNLAETATRLDLSVHTVKKYLTESLATIRNAQLAKEQS
jgi:RNA polymerase sigma-70 factor (ECF subfamily)